MDAEQKPEHTHNSDCPHCHGRHYLLLRWLLGILILVVVFWLGMKIGELKGAYGGYYGQGMHYMRNFRPQMYNNWWPTGGMMQQNSATPAQPQAGSPSTTQPQK